MPEQSTPATSATRSLHGEHLSLGYHRSPVVQDVSLSLDPGTVTALVGPNGSGKSTLLRSLARLHAADAGSVLLDGEDAALRVADHLVLLAGGSVLAAGRPPDVLTAQNTTAAYDIPVDVGADPRTGRLRIDPVGRHTDRYLTRP